METDEFQKMLKTSNKDLVAKKCFAPLPSTVYLVSDRSFIDLMDNARSIPYVF